MCIIDKLKKNGFISTKELSDWQEQQLQAAVRPCSFWVERRKAV